MLTLLILLAAIALLSWSFYRARPYGKVGILAWLQSVALMAPWLLFFGLVAIGVYLNLAGVLLLIVVSAGLYIYLGRQLRQFRQDPSLTSQPSSGPADEGEAASPSPTESTPPSATDDGPSTDDSGGFRQPQPVSVSQIPDEDLSQLEGIFGIDTFFRTETIPYQQGAIFKGNLRGEPTETLEKLNGALWERLGDRYRLYLIESPEGKPAIVALPSSRDPQPLTPTQKALAVFLAVATLLTCFETSGLLMNIDLLDTPGQWVQVWPIALGIVTVLVVHELGHWFMARRHEVKLSWPFFLPTWQIGSFGALTRFASVLPNRNVLFDVAFAGPAAGGLLSLAMLYLGLVLSHPGSAFQIPSAFFQGSALVGALAKGVLGDALAQEVVDVHPLTVVGWLGMVITALNLMPAGQLDGGRLVQAVYGRKIAGRATVITLIVLAIAALANVIALYWGLLILILQRNLERPAANELTEPDDARAALALLVLFLMLATLVPLTPSLAGRLGIGG